VGHPSERWDTHPNGGTPIRRTPASVPRGHRLDTHPADTRLTQPQGGRPGRGRMGDRGGACRSGGCPVRWPVKSDTLATDGRPRRSDRREASPGGGVSERVPHDWPHLRWVSIRRLCAADRPGREVGVHSPVKSDTLATDGRPRRSGRREASLGGGVSERVPHDWPHLRWVSIRRLSIRRLCAADRPGREVGVHSASCPLGVLSLGVLSTRRPGRRVHQAPAPSGTPGSAGGCPLRRKPAAEKRRSPGPRPRLTPSSWVTRRRAPAIDRVPAVAGERQGGGSPGQVAHRRARGRNRMSIRMATALARRCASESCGRISVAPRSGRYRA
jgi:hypothetical protein